MRGAALCLGVALLGCPTDPPPVDLGPPDILVVVLDTTTRAAVGDAMPNAQAFIDEGLSWDLAVSPSNTTVDSVGGLFQDRFLVTTDFAPGQDSTASTTLAERMAAAGYNTLLASANHALDHELFSRGFSESYVRDRDALTGGDADSVATFIEAWEQLPQPRFGWLQVLAGHDYLAAPADAVLPPVTDEELALAWTWYTDDARATDALLPAVFDLVPPEAGLTVLTADHGELFRDRGAFMIGSPDSFGHGEANAPMELYVPLAMQGRGGEPGQRTGPVSTMNVHGTVLAAAGIADGTDLRSGVGQRQSGSSLCNLLNLQVTEGAGNMSVWVLDDGSQLVRTHAPDALPEADAPPLLVRWPAAGVGLQRSWEALQLTDLTSAQTTFLFDEALPECKGFRDLCEEYPELEAIGYIDCD